MVPVGDGVPQERGGVQPVGADDVGAGNAGLRLLSQFRFDIVKVDLSLVQEGANNDASRAISTACVRLCTPSLRMMAVTCALTVVSAMVSS